MELWVCVDGVCGGDGETYDKISYCLSGRIMPELLEVVKRPKGLFVRKKRGRKMGAMRAICALLGYGSEPPRGSMHHAL